ncbi:hypothetical protein BH23ACT12_BH23ACT12_13960 [soil metagenome]
MAMPGITTEELESALGGLYTAPKDPDAPDFEMPEPATVDETPVAVIAPGFTVEEMGEFLGDLYTAPTLEEAA